MSSRIYTPTFRTVYERSGAKLPIDQWCDLIGSKLNQFRNPSDIYMPVPLDIRIADRADVSAVKMQVSPSDEQWYPKLVSAVQDMMKTTQPIKIQT